MNEDLKARFADLTDQAKMRLEASLRMRIALLVFCSLLPSLIVVILNLGDLSVLARYWDGPVYMEAAKTLYHLSADHPLSRYYGVEHLAAALPLYPLLIRAFSFLSYPVALIFISMAAAAAGTVAYYFLLVEYACVQNALYSAAISTVLPLRWLVYKTVGATEPLFFLLVCLSLLFYKRDRLYLAILFAALSCVTRFVGVAFIGLYVIEFIRTRRFSKLWMPLLIAVPLLDTFAWYGQTFGNFLEFFKADGELVRLNAIRGFAQMSAHADTLGAELYFLFFVVYGTGILFLWKQRTLFTWSLLVYGIVMSVFNNDLSRYFLPIAPFALIVAYDRVLNTRQFRLGLPALICLGIIYVNGVLPTNGIDASALARLLAYPSYP